MVNLNRKIKVAFLALAMTFPIFTVAANSDKHSTNESEKKALFENLYRAENEQEGRIAEDAVWRFWFDQSPTTTVRTYLDAGIERREAYDYEAAEHHLDKVVQSAPEYAEGYNQRAFVRFLRENYYDAKTDLEMALKLEPNHFGALSGLYHILQRQDKRDAALNMLKLAVEIHPWLKERSALPEEMWPKSYRNLHAPGTKI